MIAMSRSAASAASQSRSAARNMDPVGLLGVTTRIARVLDDKAPRILSRSIDQRP